MTNLTDYICINHHLMTVKEMAEETGENEQRIRRICKENNWTPLASVDRLKDYIKAHPGAIAEDIAERFDTGAQYVKELAKAEGIELMTRFQAEGKKEKPKKKQEIRYSLMHRAFNDSDPVTVHQELDMLLKEPGKVKRVRDAYNQSGSPYGIADQVKDIKLK